MKRTPVGLAIHTLRAAARVPELTEQIDHHRCRMHARLAQRQTAQCAHLLLILRRDTGVDGVVAAVVRPRRHFVHDELAATDEELDSEGADVGEPFRDPLGHLPGGILLAGRGAGRGDGDVENAVAMAVLASGKACDAAVPSRASTTETS